MNLDVIDRYLQEMKELKELERIQREKEELAGKLKAIQVDGPIRILKKIIENKYQPSRLPKEWIDSGLYDMVNKEIDLRAKIKVRAIVDLEDRQ